MIYLLYASLLLVLAAIPTLMVWRNLPLFHLAAETGPGELPAVSVLVPARNEEHCIAQSIASILHSQAVRLEVVVMDDHSTDRTAAIISQLAGSDPRVRLVHAPELPAGWNGKQHACWELARVAKYETLLFVDADVQLSVDALARLLAEHRPGRVAGEVGGRVALLSGFPNQITVSLAEKLLIPMMHFVLLGYLPLDRMRSSHQPEFGAGCGQLFLTGRDDYMRMGGHGTIRQSRHDGLQLPRAYRRAGLSTDLIDASDIASVRMYTGWSSVLQGLQKNATEGIANSKLIVLFSVLLLGAAVLPLLSLGHAWYHGWPPASVGILAVASLLSFLPRGLLAARLHQSWWGVLLHPLAVSVFVAVQWIAYIRAACGWGQVAWKGRS